MLFFEYLLVEELRKYQHIIVYGTGYFAEKIYPALCESGLDQNILAFAVSRSLSKKPFDKFQVMYIDEIGEELCDTVVLLAAGEEFQEDMYSNARDAGYKNIVLLTDYFRTDQNMMRYFQDLDYAQFCNLLIKSYLYKHKEENDGIEIIKQRLCQLEIQNTFDEKQIVFISGHFTPRSSKIIRALNRKGFQVVVLLYGSYCGENFADEILEDGISLKKYTDEESMTFCAMQYKPLAYYLEPKWGNCIWTSFLISFRSHFRPIILGLYDVLNDGYVLEDSALLEKERFALEHADGLVWRWFSKEYLEKTKKFVFQGKSVQFHDYCEGSVLCDRKPKAGICEKNCEVLKLCSVQGSFWDFSQEGDLEPGQRGFASLQDILDVLGNSKKCILHVYVGRFDQKGYEAGKEIESRFSNVCFFWNVGHKELVERLLEYDFGCEFYNEGFAPLPDSEIRYGINRYYESVNINSVSNRFYDYLDANLPIVSMMPDRQMEFLGKYGVVVRMSLQKFDIEFLMQNKEKLKRNVEKAKTMLTADYHISELIGFFEEVSAWKEEMKRNGNM